MKTIMMALTFALTAPLFAQEVKTYQLSTGPKACPVEVTIIQTENCLQVSLMQEDAEVQLNEYCQINDEAQKVQVIDEETGKTTTTYTRQVQLAKSYLFTKNTTVQNVHGLVVANHYEEMALKAGEKSAVLTVRDQNVEMMKVPTMKTLACFYSTDAE
ncbi:MAG: hypothetical protein COW00_00255 [Bdellovibrio sp. CG12_big_fil_rev_8_21_14_0_65_39_13]|nr:MAG: hypothetical protein COW78_19840 [Bdellovibrio sp. CG22_combo_CG10-13_8_21_14_all_39_27]PIQ62915.1 MAG: hypothetical protein COW00_00255 [Bdellovibrio sp. CG12_big_fil_rev_8_21_14_0_65_39_13]PIR33270.1 MAG: hypothetical protein COV37_16990 [Bdellovibrio sp. CG11_big_fil_rev_8_21_14_0_20_39_38]PJB54591.1 MAG: hypothetical protein CO099_00670 [Bdellovibrio sp. CG_4_9_14_3_um_filter_39_7]